MTPERFREYQARGFALCRIPAGQKMPVEPLWQLNPVLDFDGFRATDAVGLILGPLSGCLMCVDLDFHDQDQEAWAIADEVLPATGLIDGRPGKPQAHRYYTITDVEWPDSVLPRTGSTTRQAMEQGLLARFAGSRHFADGDKRAVDLLGAGSQVVIPPSLHKSGDQRLWHENECGLPASVSYADLLAATVLMVERLGLKLPGQATSEDAPEPPAAADLDQVPLAQRIKRLSAYLQAAPACEHGKHHGFHAQQWRIACTCAELGVPYDEALPLYQEWNRKSSTPDPEAVNQSTLASAYRVAVFGARAVNDTEVDLSHLCPAMAPEAAGTPDTSEDLQPISIAVLVERYPKLMGPLIDGLLRRGETMNVIAASKTGKSWLIMSLAISVATGQPWLGSFPTVPGRVLIIDNELHRNTTSDRTQKLMSTMGLDLAEIAPRIDVLSLRGHLKDLIGIGNILNKKQPGTYQLVIIDAWYRTIPLGVDENDNGAVAGLYNHIDALAARLQCSFALVHHTSKGNQSGKGVTDVGSGAGSQSRAADTHLVIRAHREEGAVAIHAVVRSWKPVKPFCLRHRFPVWVPDPDLDPNDLDTGRLRTSTGDQAQEAEPDEEWTPAVLVKALLSEEPKSLDRILEDARGYDLSQRRVERLLHVAVEEGLAHEWPGRCRRFATLPAPPVEQVDPDHCDKREQVVRCLIDHPDWSARDIAQECQVSRQYVYTLRQEIDHDGKEQCNA